MGNLNNAQTIIEYIKCASKANTKTADNEKIQHAAGYANAFVDMQKDIDDEEFSKIMRMLVSCIEVV